MTFIQEGSGLGVGKLWPADGLLVFVNICLWKQGYAHSFTFVLDCFQTIVTELGSYGSVPWSRSLKYLLSDPFRKKNLLILGVD